MRRSILHITLGLAGLTAAIQTPTDTVASLLATDLEVHAAAAAVQNSSNVLSPCVTNCTTTELAKSPCQPTDLACICTNQQLNAGISTCLMQSCTVIESLEALRYQKTSCGAPVRRNTDQPPITWTLFSVSVLAVTSRLLSKLPAFNPAFTLGWDDWTILASMIALVPADVGSQIIVGLGLGQDIWMLPPNNITGILLVFFIEELLYSFVVAGTKLSMIIFYLRLFSDDRFRKVCYAILAVTAAYGVGQILAVSLVCTPVEFNWNGWDGQHAGKCGNISVMVFTNGGINIAIDFSLFVLPVTQFVSVSWTLRKRVGVSLIFLVGLLVTICSGIRLATVAMFAGTQNPTLDYKSLSIWSLVEMHLSVICACMPGMTAFIRRVKPRLPCHRSEVDTPQQNRNQPRTGRSIARRIRETFTRITGVARDTVNSRSWKGSKKTTTSTGTQPSAVDPHAPEYQDYLVYATYVDSNVKGGGDKGIELRSVGQNMTEHGGTIEMDEGVGPSQSRDDAAPNESR